MGSLALITLLALMGAVGAVARFLVDLWLEPFGRGAQGARFPLSTMVVNVSGALLAGVVAGAVASGTLAPTPAAAASIGFLGAFTTFSTWMVQVLDLWEGGKGRMALLHLLGALAAGVTAAALGVWLAVRLALVL